ncbi:MAG: oligosaccharide flippase family protein [Bacilli bacterium]
MEKAMSKDLSSKFVRGAMILSVSTFIVKIMSAFYRIPLQNLTGDLGMYAYQQVYPFYALFAVLGMTAFPMLFSRVWSENDAHVQQNERLPMRHLLWSIAIVGFCIGSGLILFRKTISLLLGHPSFESAIIVIAICYLLLPIVTVVRGVFQAEGEALPLAYANVLEQGVRVSGILLVSVTVVVFQLSVYAIGLLAIIGSIAGSVIGTLYLMRTAQFRMLYPDLKKRLGQAPGFGVSFRTFLKTGVGIALSSLVVVCFQFVDSFTFVPTFQAVGMADFNIFIMKGVYDRAQPVIQLGTVVGSGFAITLIPLVVKLRGMGQSLRAKNEAERALWLSIVLSCASAFGLIAIMRPLTLFLFSDDVGTMSLMLNALSVCFLGYVLTVSSLLHGVYETKRVAYALVVGVVVKFTLGLMLATQLGVYAFSLSNVIGYGVIAVMLNRILRQTLAIRIKGNDLVKLMVSLMMMTVVVFLFTHECKPFYMDSRTMAAVVAVCGSAIGGVMFLMLCRIGSILKYEHVELLPVVHRFWRK